MGRAEVAGFGYANHRHAKNEHVDLQQGPSFLSILDRVLTGRKMIQKRREPHYLTDIETKQILNRAPKRSALPASLKGFSYASR
jgi:hypothetical protein